jgi:hypothetical protein
MVILYDIGLVLALLTGGAIGVLVTAAHYEQLALKRWAYEKEVAEGREFHAALAMFRRIKPDHPADDEASAARTGAVVTARPAKA